MNSEYERKPECNKCRCQWANNGINLKNWTPITLPVSMDWLWRVIKLKRTNHPDRCWMHRTLAISRVQAKALAAPMLNAIVLSRLYRAKSTLAKTKHSLNLYKTTYSPWNAPKVLFNAFEAGIFVCGVSDASSLILVHHPGFCAFEDSLSNLCVWSISMTTGPMSRI